MTRSVILVAGNGFGVAFAGSIYCVRSTVQGYLYRVLVHRKNIADDLPTFPLSDIQKRPIDEGLFTLRD